MVQIPNAPPERRLELLKQAFPYIREKDVAPVVFSLLGSINPKPQEQLNELVEIREVHANLPTAVAAAMWESHPEKFDDCIKQTCHAYAKKGPHHFLVELVLIPRATPLDREARRKTSAPISTLLADIANSAVLYSRATQVLSNLVKKKYNVGALRALCNLRSQLIVSLRDQNLEQVYGEDLTAKYVWAFEMCRTGYLEGRTVADLLELIKPKKESAKEGREKDLFIVLADPTNIALFVSTFLRTLEVQGTDIDRVALCQLIATGLDVRKFLKSPQVQDIKPRVVEKFCHTLAPGVASDGVPPLLAEYAFFSPYIFGSPASCWTRLLAVLQSAFRSQLDGRRCDDGHV